MAFRQVSGALRGCPHLPAPSLCPRVVRGFLTALSPHSPHACTAGEIVAPFTSLSPLFPGVTARHHLSSAASLWAEDGNCRFFVQTALADNMDVALPTTESDFSQLWRLDVWDHGPSWVRLWQELSSRSQAASFSLCPHPDRAERRELSLESEKALILFVRAPPSYPL